MTTYETAIIGGGIVGLASALELTKNGRGKVVVLEAEDHVAAHQTGHNSGVIHSGLYYKPGSLEGAELHRADATRCIASAPSTASRTSAAAKSSSRHRKRKFRPLNELERRGRENGLAGITRLSAAMLKEHRAARRRDRRRFSCPQTGIVDYPGVTNKYAELVRETGGEVLLACRRPRITNNGIGNCHRNAARRSTRKDLINCAGLQSDRIARMCGLDPGVQIIPFRGEYYELSRQSIIWSRI